MVFTDDQLDAIYDRTSGYCHICRKKLAFKNYGKLGQRGAWEVEHSRAQAKGGTDRLNNLYPACITCNRRKGTRTTRTLRSFLFARVSPRVCFEPLVWEHTSPVNHCLAFD